MSVAYSHEMKHARYTGPMSSLPASALLERKPDILVILTDQERYHTHWPAGLRERLMPSWGRLASRGLTFHRAYCSSAQCSPSRACLLTGQYSNVNGVPSLAGAGMPTIAQLPNVATVLHAAGYDVFWKGKWHLSFPLGFHPPAPPSDEVWTEADIPALYKNYAMQDWNTPDAGNAAGAYMPPPNSDANDKARAADISTCGGGNANNDGRYVDGYQPGTRQTPGYGESALSLLERMAQTPRPNRKPFALFVSLVNPHDITFFPDAWQEAGYSPADLAGLDVAMPPNAADTLDGKPSVQTAYRDALNTRSPLTGEANTPQNYVNFYAYLHSVVEPHIEKLLDFLTTSGMLDSTIIFRTADHGELGLSHGLREKSYSAYEEMIHVPLVISNPLLFPAGAETDAFYSHVDLLPTLAELAQTRPVGVGKSMLPVIRNPAASVQDEVLFTFDDDFVLSAGTPGSHIRALRAGNWTYAVYYSATGGPFEYELYDDENDPGQMINLVNTGTPLTIAKWREMHRLLVAKMEEANATPAGFSFPAEPVLTAGSPQSV